MLDKLDIASKPLQNMTDLSVSKQNHDISVISSSKQAQNMEVSKLSNLSKWRYILISIQDSKAIIENCLDTFDISGMLFSYCCFTCSVAY
jgi:hypothetical protein